MTLWRPPETPTTTPGSPSPSHRRVLVAQTLSPSKPPPLPTRGMKEALTRPAHAAGAGSVQLSPAEAAVPEPGGPRRSPQRPARPSCELRDHRTADRATAVTKNAALFVFKHDIHGGFAVCMLQRALFLAPCLLKLGPLFSTVYQDQYV